MSDGTPKFTDELKHDLHGEQVGKAHQFICDYCDGKISITEPVMYEALRVVDMPNLEKLIGPPDEWMLDAARCRNCEIERLDPATDGYDEALILLSINESNSILSADTTNMTVVDVSPDGEGYYPPLVGLTLLVKRRDPGYPRWMRMKGVLDNLESGDYPADFVKSMRETVRQSKETPPDVSL